MVDNSLTPAQEVRLMIYHTKICSSPRVLNRECRGRLVFDPHKAGPQHDKLPCVQILRVSKIVNAEATSILYSYNTFTNLYAKSNDELYDILEGIEGLSCEFTWNCGASWAAFRHRLVEAVGKLFELDDQKLPEWLLGSEDMVDLTLQDTKRWGETTLLIRVDSTRTTTTARRDLTSQDFFARLGHRMLPKSKWYNLPSAIYPRVADHLPLYAEILKQHMTGLQKLIIGKTS